MIRKNIIKLKELGRIPNHEEEDNLIEEFEFLLSTIEKPITKEEGEVLILLFPREHCFGLESTLLHLIESLFTEISLPEYRNLVLLCDNDIWKETLLERLNNFL